MDDLDLSTWDAQQPTPGFAGRVLEVALQHRESEVAPRRAPRWHWLAAAIVSTVAVAAAAWIAFPEQVSEGSLVADSRVEQRVGERAVVVLEEGSVLSWKGEEIKQSAGEAFYRVEPGSSLTVTTPAGRIEVLGTCFRVHVRPPQESERADETSHADNTEHGALTIVSVYEGKVAAVQGRHRAMLRPGQSAKLGPGGVELLSGGAAIEEAHAQLSQPVVDEAFAEANANLVKEVSQLNRRLRALEQRKAELEGRLTTARKKLGSLAEGQAPRLRDEFDLDVDDWKLLAKDGTIKYRIPCQKHWTPTPEAHDALGLAPGDVEIINAAHLRSQGRVWGVVRQLCVNAVGNAQIVDEIGLNTCVHLVLNQARREDMSATNEALRQVSEIRAGEREATSDEVPRHPVMDLFLTLTKEMQLFEADLSASFGPGEAKQIAWAAEICKSTSVFGGPGPREP